MATTYTLISSNVLTGSAASVTFSSIPSTYTDLVLRVSARSDSTQTTANLALTFNSDTGTNYSHTLLRGDGATATSTRGTNTTRQIFSFSVDPSGYTASSFGSAEIYIPNYTSTSSRPISEFGVTETNATTANMAAIAGLYRGSSAISTILIEESNANNFVSGSSFYLYGIKNS